MTRLLWLAPLIGLLLPRNADSACCYFSAKNADILQPAQKAIITWDLQQLAGHFTEGLFITKFRKAFTRGEMNDDLAIVRARYNDTEDRSEYEEILPSSPP